jgi:hypothetical protein
MKIFTKMAAVVLACVLAVPGEARVNVVYQRQDSLRIVGLLQQAREQINPTIQKHLFITYALILMMIL